MTRQFTACSRRNSSCRGLRNTAAFLLACLFGATCGCGSDDRPAPVEPSVEEPETDPLAPAFDEEFGIRSDPTEPGSDNHEDPANATGASRSSKESEPKSKDPGELDSERDPAEKPASETPAVEEPGVEEPGVEEPGVEKQVGDAARLENELAAFKIPPDWLSSIQSKWDVASKPWGEGRQEIRRLLGKSDDASRREGIKLTWDYLQKNDIGDGHEYGMYMFMGNEPLWAIIAFRDFVNRPGQKYPPYFGLGALASLYADYGLFEEAEKQLLRAVDMAPPKAEWVEMRKAEMHDELGDLYADWGESEKAKSSYRESMRWYSKAKPPHGRHLLPRRSRKVQSKLDLLTQASLQGVSLRDGTYRETALGYSGDIKLTVKVSGGKVVDINVIHEEKIEQNASKIIPKRIIEKQSLRVDGISGATVTKDAIVAGTLRALKKAGLE